MAYRDVILNDNPEAYWRFGESSGSTAFDETANGHDGTYQGDPTLGAAGALTNDDDTAVYMDGAGDAVDLGDVINPQIGSFSLEAWIKVDDVSIQGQRIQAKQDGIDGWAFSVGDPGSGAIRFFIRNSATIVSLDTATGVVSNGVWHHVVGVYDASAGTRKIYVDAVEEASATDDTGGFPTNTANYVLSAQRVDGNISKELAGVADEYAVYLSALSATQIQTHYDEATKEFVTLSSHTVVLNHMPQFNGRFSPHVIQLNHFQAVPTQYHIVNLAHQTSDYVGDTSEQGQATALRKLLGYGWGVPDPAGSANEKIETPRESWPIHRFHEAERLLRQEGVEEPTAQALGDALRRLGEDIHLDVKENLQRYEWHANAHTHSGVAGAEGTPVGPAEALFTVSGGGALVRRLASDGSVFWSRGSNYGDLAVDPVERRVYAIGRADDPNGGTLVNTIDRVVSYDFDGVEQWNVDLHQRLGDASETVWAFTLARDRSALYTIYNDGSQFGVVRIGTSDGSVSVVGKDTPSAVELWPSATFDMDGDYLYLSDREFVNSNRGRIIKFSLGDGHIVWEMSPDLANQHDCPLCATDTLLWAQKENGKVILIDKASGGINSIVDLSGVDGASGGNLWKDFHNTNSLYVLGTNFNVPDTWLYRLYPLGGTIQAEELKFIEDLDMGRVVRDGEGNFFLGGGSGSTSHLMKLSPSLEVKWRIDGPSPRNFCTDQGRSVHWG